MTDSTRRTIFIVIVALAAAAIIVPRLGRSNAVLAPAESDFKTATARARTEKKFIYAEFYAHWCEACKEFEHAVLADPEVNAAMEKLVFLRVDVDKNADLAKEFDILAIPAGFLLKMDGGKYSIVARHEGIMEKADFLRFLIPAR